MAGGIQIKGKLTGLEDVVAALGRLEKRTTRNKIQRKALTKAVKPILQAAKDTVPQESGLLRKSLGSKTWTKEDTVMVIAGPRTGWKREVTVRNKTVFRNPTKYGHLVERGTAPHDIMPTTGPFAGRVIHHPGSIATHFLERAFDSSQAEASRVAVEIMTQGIEAEWAKKAGAA